MATKPQQAQEALYEFPYHYIPRWGGGNFSQVRPLNWGYEYASYLKFVSDYLKRLTWTSLADVGCGDGRFLVELSRLYPERALTGIDYSETAIRWANAFAPNMKWVRADISDGDAPSQQYDVVTLIETLEHIETNRLEDFVSALRRLVRDDGRLLVTVPSKNVKVTNHHVQHFDLQSLTKTLSPLFIIEDVAYLNSNSDRLKFLLQRICTNRHFVIVSPWVWSKLFKHYCAKHLVGAPENTRRIFVSCRPA